MAFTVTGFITAKISLPSPKHCIAHFTSPLSRNIFRLHTKITKMDFIPPNINQNYVKHPPTPPILINAQQHNKCNTIFFNGKKSYIVRIKMKNTLRGIQLPMSLELMDPPFWGKMTHIWVGSSFRGTDRNFFVTGSSFMREI